MEKVIKEKEQIKYNSGIIGGTFSLSLSTVIVKLLGLIYKIPLAGLLGDEGMGFFNSAYTVYTFFYLLCTAGVPKAVMIMVSEAKARGKTVDENRIVFIASRLFLILGVTISLLFMAFSSPLAMLIGNSRSAATMLAIAPSIIFISLSGVIRGYLTANMRLLDIAVSQIIEGVGKLAMGLILAQWSTRAGMPLEIVSALTILGVSFGAFTGLLYLLVCSKMRIRQEKIGQSKVKGDTLIIIKRILSISLPITVSAAVMSITNIIDLGLIMRSLISIGYTEAEASALYGNYTTLAVPMLNLAISVITPISVAHLPIFTKSCIKGDISSEGRSIRDALKLSMMLAAPMTLGMMVYAREILEVLFPSSETIIGGSLLCLLAPSIIFSSLLLITNTVLEARGRVKAPLISMLVGSFLKIIVSYILIRNPEIGIAGAPIGTFVSYAAALLVSCFICTKVRGEGMHIFSSCTVYFLFAGAAILLSRPLYIVIIDKVGKIIGLGIAISLCAAVYFILIGLYGFLNNKKFKKIAKYTNFSS